MFFSFWLSGVVNILNNIFQKSWYQVFITPDGPAVVFSKGYPTQQIGTIQLPHARRARKLSRCKPHNKTVVSAGAKAKSVTSLLTLPSVLCAAFIFKFIQGSSKPF